ncbi:MAG TPA: hypothetical protein VFO84_04125 [Dehalococcoidia bacterium]|nr:hypothetical protein [Dehalococcoidia bacterium]
MFALVGVLIISLLYRLKYGQDGDWPNRLNTMFGFGLVGVVLLALIAFTSLPGMAALALSLGALAVLIGVFYVIIPAPP